MTKARVAVMRKGFRALVLGLGPLVLGFWSWAFESWIFDCLIRLNFNFDQKPKTKGQRPKAQDQSSPYVCFISTPSIMFATFSQRSTAASSFS